MAIINVDGLTKVYKQQNRQAGFLSAVHSLFTDNFSYKTAVDEISFQVNEGEIIGLLGPNGAGKTTVMKILSGILYPTKGKVNVAGFIPYIREKNFKKQIALIMGQKNQLIWDLPAIDTMLWLKEIYDLDNGVFNNNLKLLSNIFQAEDLLPLQVRRMSLGQRMKMELIASMLHNPKVIFLDEPTIGLDIVAQNKFHEFIKEYNRITNATIIMTSHNLLDVEALCQKVIIITNGTIIHNGSTQSLIRKYCDYIRITLEQVKEDVVSTNLLNGMEIVEREKDKVILKIKREISRESIKFLWSNFTFKDFRVEDIGINDIIEKVFSEGVVKL